MVPMTDILRDIQAELHATEAHLRNWNGNGNETNTNVPQDELNTQQTTPMRDIQDHQMTTPKLRYGVPKARKAEVVWHCSECGDGPYGTWQSVCQSCRHIKCGSCQQEET
jgi:hypothetical protein